MNYLIQSAHAQRNGLTANADSIGGALEAAFNLVVYYGGTVVIQDGDRLVAQVTVEYFDGSEEDA